MARNNKANYEKWHKRHKEELNKKRRETYQKYKQIVFLAYGNACACCKESAKEFLTLDHVNGDGWKHRKEKTNQVALFKDIIMQEFPKDKYRLLCWNCNESLAHHGYCPHGKLSQ